MNTPKVAAALNTISLAFGELAEALTDAPQAPVAAQEPSPFVDLPDEVFAAPQGSLSVCPKHKVEYRPSKKPGAPGYCPTKDDEPNWSFNGYCSISPKSAAAWLSQHA